MASNSLSREEKERLLRALEEDREFRYALMGLLGYREILDRITRLEERFAALEERFARLEERQQRLEEEFRKLYERQLQLEERQQRLEERFAGLEKRFADLEERFARLEERVARLEERMLKVEERLEEHSKAIRSLQEEIVRLNRTLATVAHRFGVMSEGAFREAMKGLLTEYFGAEAFRWTAFDREGIVYGHPSEVEVDVVIRDGKHILVEVKSRVDTSDVLELTRIAKLYEKREGVKPELAIVGGFVHPRAKKLAEELGVKIYTYLEEEK
jgi:hypothetical protein